MLDWMFDCYFEFLLTLVDWLWVAGNFLCEIMDILFICVWWVMVYDIGVGMMKLEIERRALNCNRFGLGFCWLRWIAVIVSCLFGMNYVDEWL